jgi:hypothetical protein
MIQMQVHVDSSADIVKVLGAEEPYPALYVYKVRFLAAVIYLVP